MKIKPKNVVVFQGRSRNMKASLFILMKYIEKTLIFPLNLDLKTNQKISQNFEN